MKRAAAYIIALLLLCGSLRTTALADEPQTAKLIALTYDDGPDGRYTQELLDGLALRPDVKVTFFFLGQYSKMYPEDVLYAWRLGHQVGSHTYDHSALGSMYWDQAIISEVEKTEDVLCPLTGQEPHLMVRPPYGSLNSVVMSVIDRPVIIWSSDPGDWKGYSSSTLCSNICNDAIDGAIIGLHCTKAPTVDATLDAVDILLQDGFQFVTVQELLWLRGVSPEDNTKYYNGFLDEGEQAIVNWGWFDEDAGRCWFDREGWRHTGWLHTGGRTYYLDPQTSFLSTGWTYVDGVWYDFGESGVLRATSSGPNLRDVAPGEDAYRDIRRCARMGLLETPDNAFRPQEAVTPAELAHALWRLAGAPQQDATDWARERGLLPEGEAVTRTQAAQSMARFAAQVGKSESECLALLAEPEQSPAPQSPGPETESGSQTQSETASEAEDEVGDDTDPLTRAQTARLLVRLKDYITR